ncbi:hypothetical protein F442_02284 [Phytophthora nicotianae P10297]|uniref:Uncharacterized protein n=1 Tax=Phytophthora nicotianae P10297 TaxID=1317064 RepID=W3A0N9_PHYNI|nr:hypothetical protein F442_02284 [Phytophthora nicotianae P10297]
MPQVLPHQALGVVVRLGRSKHRTKHVVGHTSTEEVPEANRSSINSEVRELDEKCNDETRDRPKRPDKKRVMLRFGGRRSLSSRRHQFTVWKDQAASNAVKTLRGCYALARQELTAWRNRSKTPPHEGQSSEVKASPSKRPRTNSRISAASSTSIVGSLSSTIELEEEHRKELYRSEFSFRVRRSSSLEMKPSQRGFAEMPRGSHERLLVVHALPLNDEDDDDDSSVNSRHLPFRTVCINGHERVLHNEWI